MLLLVLAGFANQRSYFVVGELATTNEEVVRIAGLLRGTESAVQAVSVSLHPALHNLPLTAEVWSQ